MSIASLRQSMDAEHCLMVPMEAAAIASGSISSMTLEWRRAPSSLSSGCVRQSVRNIEPCESETRNSLLVPGCARMDVRGCGNGIT